MAIKIRRPAFYKISAVKEFTDRTEPRKAFWNRYAKMVDEGSTVISFYGAGGVGKSALLKKIEEEIKHRDELTGNECKYVRYDFSISTGMLDFLKTLKFQLSAYGCEFPLFEVGNYYYSLKIGQDVTPPKATSALEKIPWVQKMKKTLSKTGNVSKKTMPAVGTTEKIFNTLTDEDENLAELFLSGTAEILSETTPVMKTVTTFMSLADTLLLKYMEYNEVLDEDHAEIRFQLNARRMEKLPTAIYEYLPTLFAQDVADWMNETGNKLVVFLDNYESLIGATVLQTTEQRKRDSWLSGDAGLIFMIPDTLWIIAGRNKLRWDGALADETEQHLIKALSPEDSNWFLERAGVVDENLRGELVKLTEGYPIFLDLCVDVYTEYKRQHDNAEPTIDEFGKKREDVVGRIFRYLDAAGDDSARNMLEFLCVLNVWTEDLAEEISKQTFRYFNYNTYKRVKNFSFIQSERVANEDLDLTVCRFDKTIQSILITQLKAEDEKFIDAVKTSVDSHFKKFFAGKKTLNAKKIFYLKLWAEFIVRFTDDAEKLFEQYQDTLDGWVSALTYYAEFDAADEILKLFMNKLESLNETDIVSYAYFEMYLGQLRRAQGNYNEAYELAKSAYEKCVRLLGDEHPDTIGSMIDFSNSLNKLGRYDEALTLQEQVLSLRKKILGDEHPYTIYAMQGLAISLSGLGRYDEALTLQEQVLSLYKKILGDEHPYTLMAMQGLAISLSALGRYDEALNLQEQVLSLRKKILGDEHPDTISAMNNLANSLSDLGRYDEALTLNEQVLSLYKKILGEEHPYTIMAMGNLANSLSYLGRYDEALTLNEQVLTLRKKILGDEHPDTVGSMNGLAWTLTLLNRHDEALKLMESALPLFKKVFGEDATKTLGATDTMVHALSGLGRYEEAITLQRDTLTRCEETLGDEHPLTVTVMKNLAKILHDGGNNEKALTIIEVAEMLAYEVFGDEHPETKEILDLREKILSGTA